MAIEFKNSETKSNLMRSFAGESMARNRYTFAASEAKKQKLPVIEAVFTFTANQEKEHAEIFYGLLKELSGQNLEVCANYPVDVTENVASLLSDARHNEYEEHDVIYKSFGEKAKEEGFARVAAIYNMIAEIEKTHGKRFEALYEMMEQNKLFISDVECKWMCLNCGHIYTGKEAPEVCPVCEHARGYFIRLELAPYTSSL